MQDRDLDALLALAAQERPAPSAALIDRVLADALAIQSERAGPSPLPADPKSRGRTGLLARLAAAFGGTPALAGVCGAALVGVAFGYLNPAALDMLTGGLAGAETLELFPSADFLMTEG